MSHVPQRKEKDCLNCGAIVQGRYCHVCGQENVVPKETFWHMVTHFFYDITHFDSSFFTTIKDLLFKPGFLSKEYMKGRRASYLHPIKMYVFTSAIFFLLFFSFFVSTKDFTASKKLNAKERAVYISIIREQLQKDTASFFLKEKLLLLEDSSRIVTSTDMRGIDITKVSNKNNEGLNISFGSTYKTVEEYDSVQKTLPPSKRDGWLGRRFTKIGIDIDRKFREDPDNAARQLADSILHRLPYMLLISLPFFALILKLVYMRRKSFYYADHGVFTIHLYVFSFLMLLLVFCFDKLGNVVPSKLQTILIVLSFLTMVFYLYRAMHVFYGQSWWKTFLKFFIVALVSLIMMIALFVMMAIFSAATL